MGAEAGPLQAWEEDIARLRAVRGDQEQLAWVTGAWRVSEAEGEEWHAAALAGALPALVATEHDWNGWAVVRFTRRVAEVLVAEQQALGAPEAGEADRLAWSEDGQAVLRWWAWDEEGEGPSREEPDADGLFSIGSCSWCWERVAPIDQVGWVVVVTRPDGTSTAFTDVVHPTRQGAERVAARWARSPRARQEGTRFAVARLPLGPEPAPAEVALEELILLAQDLALGNTEYDELSERARALLERLDDRPGEQEREEDREGVSSVCARCGAPLQASLEVDLDEVVVDAHGRMVGWTVVHADPDLPLQAAQARIYCAGDCGGPHH